MPSIKLNIRDYSNLMRFIEYFRTAQVATEAKFHPQASVMTALCWIGSSFKTTLRLRHFEKSQPGYRHLD